MPVGLRKHQWLQDWGGLATMELPGGSLNKDKVKMPPLWILLEWLRETPELWWLRILLRNAAALPQWN